MNRVIHVMLDAHPWLDWTINNAWLESGLVSVVKVEVGISNGN